MSQNDLRKKNRRNMKRPHTRPVKVGRYYLTSHAQNKIVLYDFTADCVINNLCRKPKVKTKPSPNGKGLSYLRINEEITTAINPDNNYVPTLYRTKKEIGKKYGFKVVNHLERESERKKRFKQESSRKSRSKKLKTNSTNKKTIKKRSKGGHKSWK